MSAQVIAFAATPAPRAYPPASPATPLRALPPRGLQMDISTLVGKLERTLRWLDRHQIEIVEATITKLGTAEVHARGTARLHQILADEMVSRGHDYDGAGRIERMEARDPSTGVLICWEEEVVR